MIPSQISVVALFTATLVSGIPVPGTPGYIESSNQPKSLNSLNRTLEKIVGRNPLSSMQTSEERIWSPKSHKGEHGFLQSQSFESNGTADITGQSLRPRSTWNKLDGCTLEQEYKNGLCINMVNATPYRWRRGYQHSYHMSDWDKRWPLYVEPGQSIGVLAKMTHAGIFNHAGDSAAEVAYHIEGTNKPMSFMLEYRAGLPHLPWVRFLEDLEVMNHPKGAMFNLGRRLPPSGVGFILAGKEGYFVTNDGPAAWMQAILEDIGDKSLREIVLGRSHHAGMWKGDHGFPNFDFNSLTQDATVYDQLRNGGARVLDVRLMNWKGKFHECHGTLLSQSWLGSIGASYRELIEQVNQFNDDYPGELIIWDIHPTDAWKFDGGQYSVLGARDRARFLTELKSLNHRITLPGDQDITKLPLKYFIGGKKKSAVIIRIDERWLEGMDRKDWPGPQEGFVTSRQFPVQSTWSEKLHVQKMVDHQLQMLDELQVSPTSEVYDMQWILTLVGFYSVMPGPPLLQLANDAWDTAFRELFNNLTTDRYPNWLTVDAMQNSELKTLVLAMNHCFVLDKCGDWAKERR